MAWSSANMYAPSLHSERDLGLETRVKYHWAGLFVLMAACANTSYRYTGRDTYFGGEGKAVWVRGPWPIIQSSPHVDDVVDQLCPAIMKLEGARDRDYGQEYCGVLYSLQDGRYYASYPSPIGEVQRVGPSKRKSCTSPRHVKDERGRTVGLGDFHSHPWTPSPMSEVDRQAENQRWLIRIQFDTDCHVMKLVPNIGSARPGEVYLRQGKTWKLIGIIKPENKQLGIVTAPEN